MHPASFSDAESLVDSVYEIVSSADDESQDGRFADSLTDSLDLVARPDDVESLNENATELQERTDSIHYAEDSSGCPVPCAEVQSFQCPGGSAELSHSIQFSEVGAGSRDGMISARHIIREFDEEESASVAKGLGMQNPPSRMATAIRQSMSLECLSTREPLRIMYVGSESGRSDITRKISSAFIASAPLRQMVPGSISDGDGIYNIVPISSFGAAKVLEADEIQLMEVSEYFIKVERCTAAREYVSSQDGTSFGTTYTIEIDYDKIYTSRCVADGVRISPAWIFPHLAVFYLSATDDETDAATRNAAWEFMTRHGVPSVFISHVQAFEKPASDRWRDFIDKAGVHLCLESRDTSSEDAPIRLPIDLASFLNIDARQMNRNLAFLTGLHDKSTSPYDLEGDGSDTPTTLFKTSTKPQVGLSLGTTFDWHKRWTAILIPLLLSIFWLLAGSLGSQEPVGLTGSSLSAGLASSSSTRRTAASITTTCTIPTGTPTMTLSLTPVKTAGTSSDASTHLAGQFVGLLGDRSQTAVMEAREGKAAQATYSIEVYSSTEILVRIPSGTKMSWLAKGAIDIDIWQDSRRLKSKLSTTDEGIIIEIGKKDAHGIMNVSVVTTRRPKINETFAVDFGRQRLQDVWESVSKAVNAAGKMVTGEAESTGRAAMASVDKLRWELCLFGEAAQAYTGQTKQFFTAQVTRASSVFGHAGRRVGVEVTEQLQRTEQLRYEAGLVLLQAQVQSRLWWLKVRGQMAEHARYARKSSEFLDGRKALVEKGGPIKGGWPWWQKV
jgi:hypothetical protein